MPMSPRRSGRSTVPSSSQHPSPPSPRRGRPSHRQSSPPLTTSPPPATDDEDDDGSAEITRCVCGSQEYPFPEADVEDAGFMICCERCNVWQHGPCVGVMSEKEAPEVYFCEECRPDLHELGSRNQGHRQSRWIGGSNPQQPSRRKKSSTSHFPSSLKSRSPSPTPSDRDGGPSTATSTSKHSSKKRSTMNSRDAEYYSSTALRSSTAGDDDTKMEDEEGSPPSARSAAGIGSGSGDNRGRRKGKRLMEDEDEISPVPTSQRSHKRRRRSNDETPDAQELITDPASKGGKPKKSHKRIIRDDLDNTPAADGKDDTSERETPLLDPPPTGHRHGKRATAGAKRKYLSKSDRMDSEEPPTPTLRRPGEDAFKPARARIPQARSGLNEMRKRVGAILEFVERLQADTLQSGNETPLGITTPTPVNGTEVGEKPDLDNASSQVIMEYLTKRCLDFELKFGKYPGRYG